MRPVQQMVQAARRIQATPKNDLQLSVSTSNDELTELGSSFNGLLCTLRESIERQARFAGDASHQLRTPLTATQAAVDVALLTRANRSRIPTRTDNRTTVQSRTDKDCRVFADPGPTDRAGCRFARGYRSQPVLPSTDRFAGRPRKSRGSVLPKQRTSGVGKDGSLSCRSDDRHISIDNACKYSKPGGRL